MYEPVIFGKYLLIERIAVGGMAEIFKAKVFGVDGFEKPMVVKQILPQYARYKEFVDMFIDEAKITVSLGHGNIVPVYELGRIDGIYFIAMEYVDGRDLSLVMARAREMDCPPAPEQAAFICIDLLKGLDYAHRRRDSRGRPMGVVHRDVSPQNIMVSFDGEVKILDFGIAKAARKLVETRPGAVKGKFGYISPEQARGLPVDKRTDVFSVGVIFWELLTLKRLYSAESDIEALDKVMKAEPTPPSTERPGVPSAIDPIVLQALEKDPDDRFKDAAGFQLALSKFLYASHRSATSESLADYMKQLFRDELEEQKEIQKREQELVEKYRDKMIQALTTQTSRGRPPSSRPQTDAAGARRRTDPATRKRRTATRSPLVQKHAHADRPMAATPGPSLKTPASSPGVSLRPAIHPPAARTPEPAGRQTDPLESLPFDYEVFAVKDDPDDLTLEERGARGFGGHLLWVATVILLLGITGYVLLTRTDILRKVAGRTDRGRDTRQTIEDRDRKASTVYGHVSLRSQPAKMRSRDGTVHWAGFYVLSGEGPAVLDALPLTGKEITLVVEMAGLGQKTVRIPLQLFESIDPRAPDGKTSYKYAVSVDLQNPPPDKDPEIVMPVPPGARTPPGGARGRLEVTTLPEGSRVWLYAGYAVDLVDTDPTRPMRFMVQLNGHRTAFVNLRPYRGRSDPGSYRPDPQGPRHVRFQKVVRLQPLPEPAPAGPARGRKRRRSR